MALTVHQIESMRRSHVMAPLSPAQVSELLEGSARLARERATMLALLEQLPGTVAELRRALNTLHRLLSDGNRGGD